MENQRYLQIMESRDTEMQLVGSPRREPEGVPTVSLATLIALVHQARQSGAPPGARLALMAGDRTVGLGEMRRALLVWEE